MDKKKTAVTLKNLSKAYSPDAAALVDLTLEIAQGEILALLGPSGCGKTTTLRLIAGFEQPTHGTVALQGRTVAGSGAFVPPERRGVSMVFQEHALFPNLTVLQNVVFGVEKGKNADSAGHKRGLFMLRLVGLEHLAHRYPHELSGGERQRVALARAMAPQPVLILFDEPFSNLDADRRMRMREDVRAILKTTGSTALFVTHDQEEALYMGDRIAVLNQGRLEQVDTPEAVYQHPATRFVAEFMGHTDFIEGTVVPGGVQTEIGLIAQQTAFPPGTLVDIALRADDITFTPLPHPLAEPTSANPPSTSPGAGVPLAEPVEAPPTGSTNLHSPLSTLSAPLAEPVEALSVELVETPSTPPSPSMVLARHFKGAYNLYRLRLPSGRLVHAMQPHTTRIRPGTPIQITIDPGHTLAVFERTASK